MTKHEYRQAFRLTDREKAKIWQEISDPFRHRRAAPRRWLPAAGAAAAVACLLAIVFLRPSLEPGRRSASAPRVAAVHPSEEPAAAPPATAPRVDAFEASAHRSAAAQDNAPPIVTRETAVGRGVLRGRVFAAQTQTPLACANIVLVDSGRSVLTDSLGTFILDGLAPGDYTVIASYLGHAPQEQTLHIGPGETVTAFSLPETIVETLVAIHFDAASPMTETKGAVTARDIGRQRFERFAINDIDVADGSFFSAAPPTAGAESGGARNPNDRPYDLVYHQHHGVNPFVTTEEDALSTFAIEVDDASWTIARRYLTDGNLPPPEAIRLEEIVNRLSAGLAHTGGDDFSLHADGMPSRFGAGYHLLRLGVRARAIAAVDRKPAHLIFVIDVSGSMSREDRLELVKKALRVLVDELQPGDRVGIVTFGSDARIVLEPTAADERATILAAIDDLRIDGATNAEAGLRLAYELARRHAVAGVNNRLILCSDGVANLGHTGAATILAAVRGEADRGISLTTIGFGMGNFNDTLMEQLADKGDGTYHYVDVLADAERVFRQNLTGTLQTVGREVKIQVEFDPAAVARWRLLGYENRHLDDADFRNDQIDAGEIGAGHTSVALYEIKLTETAARAAAGGRLLDLGALRLRWAKPRYHDEAGLVTERERRLTTADLAADWPTAPPRLRAAAVAAEFAEILRESYWARGSALADLLEPVTELVRALPDDPDILELSQMIRRAADLEAQKAALPR